MQPGAYFINTAAARLGQEALLAAMKNRGFGPGWDVTQRNLPADTGEFQDEIVKEEGLYGTHHSARQPTRHRKRLLPRLSHREGI